MTEIICTGLTALSAVLVAWVSSKTTKQSAKLDAQAEQRRQESRLALKMQHANTELTVGLAMAMKHGKCNGEVEEGLQAVRDANKAYEAFLEGVAIDALVK